MKTVNPYFLHDLMSPICGLGYDDKAVSFCSKMGSISEEQYRQIINEKFVNYYNSLGADKQQKSKNALSYYLCKKNF